MNEPFLINPRRRRRRTKARKRRGRRGKGLPSALLKRMMRTHGPRQGMKKAWAEFRRGVRKNYWPDDTTGHRTAARKGWRKRRVTGKRRRTRRNYTNPFGEEVMIVGANPRRKRRRRVRRRRPSMFGFNPRRRRRRRVYRDNARRRRPYYRLNARRRRSRRRYRRNPARAVSTQIFSLKRPMGFIMPALFGFGGFYAADRIPAMVGIAGDIPRLGVKAAVGLAGSMFLGRFLGRQNAAYFAVGVAINLMRDALNTFVFRTALSGYGAFPYQEGYSQGISYGAYPDEFSQNPYE